MPFFFAESVGEEPFASPLSSPNIVFSARVHGPACSSNRLVRCATGLMDEA
jgi:hypothetical protein